MLSDISTNAPASPLYPPTHPPGGTPNCPICAITATCPPSRDPQVASGPVDKAYIVLSTPSVVAFLDIAPVSRGHVLLCPRKHSRTLGDVKAEEAAVMGFWLPIVGRGVVGGVAGEGGGGWNVVMANGHDAGQTVEHTHFHVIPRLEREAGRDATDLLGVSMGERKKLEPEEAVELMGKIKEGIREEVDKLRGSGEITDGRFLWEYWGSVEGRRGLRL